MTYAPPDADPRSAARAWLASDPDPETRAELEALLAAEAPDKELADRFGASLEFGTAGLRGVLGAGPNRMNRAVVLRTTHGLATYLLATVPDARARGVVVGYDGRKNSLLFARDTAAVLAAHGIPAHVFDQVAPTPLAAYAVKKLGAAAGVMVTASHNPAEYNGYKVYWGNGAQIIPPTDQGIALAIEAAPPGNQIPTVPRAAAEAKGLYRAVDPSVERAYLDDVRALSLIRGGEDRSFPIVYTAMHGVGNRLAQVAFREGGFSNVTSVPEQAEPDEKFPTVAFPNPEEKGAMDLSFALARKLGAELVVANDPDADRLAVAIPDSKSPTGYVQLTGNQVGTILGHYLLTGGGASPAVGSPPGSDARCVLASIVSSPLLGTIALALGVHYEETLTGFKWIANRAMDLAKEGKRFVFGYEEALGYTVGDVVRDKDGISAAVMIAEVAAVLRARGKTILTELDAIAEAYGLFVSEQVSVTKKGQDGAAEIRALMGRLRKGSPPERIGPLHVVAVCDLEAQTRVTLGTGAVTSLALPVSNVIVYELSGRSRVIARPSGTEPKIKFYFDVREPVAAGEGVKAAEGRALATLAEVKREFLALLGRPA